MGLVISIIASIDHLQPKAKLGAFRVYKTIASGSTCKVKLGGMLDPDSGKYKPVAIKMFSKTKDGKDNWDLLMTEIKIMEKLDHPNIVKQISFGEEKYEKKGKADRMFNFIVLELCQVGCLFDYVVNGAFDEKVARYFFK